MASPETSAACDELATHVVDMPIDDEQSSADAAQTGVVAALRTRDLHAPCSDGAQTPFVVIVLSLETALISIDFAGPASRPAEAMDALGRVVDPDDAQQP